MNVYVKNNFLNKNEIDFFLELYQRVESSNMWLPSAIEFWNGRTYDISNFLDDGGDREAWRKFMEILYRIRSEVYKSTNDNRVMHPDTFQIVKWVDGDGQIPHADNMDIETGGQGIAPWRIYSSVIYLNDEFDGGQTYFENLGIEIEPVPGTLSIFSCGPDHMHGVRKIYGGVRKTAISFWSDQHINKKIKLLR